MDKLRLLVVLLNLHEYGTVKKWPSKNWYSAQPIASCQGGGG